MARVDEFRTAELPCRNPLEMPEKVAKSESKEVWSVSPPRPSDILLTHAGHKIERGSVCRTEPGSGAGGVSPNPALLLPGSPASHPEGAGTHYLSGRNDLRLVLDREIH